MATRVVQAVILFLAASCAFAQSGPLTLQQAVDAYIRNNLDLEAVRYKVERTRADRIAAALKPNPSFTLTVENLPFRGPGAFDRLYEVAATYSETIELGGKRALREKAADAAVAAAEAQLEDALRRGVAEVKRLYLEALLARAAVDLSHEGRQTFEELLRFNQARFDEGAIAELEIIKVRLERVKVDSGVRLAELALRQALIRLLEKTGIPVDGGATVAGELESGRADFDIQALRTAALEFRTDVIASRAEVNAAEERLSLERARSKPDISPFAGYKRVGRDDTVLFGVNIPLKLRDRNQAEIARAEVDLKSARNRLQLAGSRAAAEVESAYAGVQSAAALIAAFENELLRQADESQSISLAAYEEGGTELLSVLEAQRTRTEVRQHYYKILFDYHSSVVALELAVGKEIRP